MLSYFIEIVLGLVCGFAMSYIGFLPAPVILIILDKLGIGDFKTNLGTITFLNLFPITIGSFMEYYKANKVNYIMGLILLVSVIIGNYFGGMFVVDKNYHLSVKTLKYIISALTFAMSVIFLISAYYDKNSI